eukprot:gb/GEZN01007625.1/.p1 GENE.gb/GEZN01007625.1/~~gb/GEZN01007625.1/.p1  ORF type:complete len:317 (+),score=34.61 gb/GEZN01007625.1/:51-953(+)
MFGTPDPFFEDELNVPFRQVLADVVKCMIIMAPLMAACVPLGKLLFPKAQDPKQPADKPGGSLWVADALFGLLFFLFLVPSIWRAVLNLASTLDSRWWGSSPDAYWCGVLLVARMACHMVMILCKGLTPGRKILLVHHVLVITIYWLGVQGGRSNFWGALNATCETSGIFTMMLELFQSTSRPVKDRISFKLNSFMMSLLFAFRMVLFPGMMAAWLLDIYVSPEKTWFNPRNGLFERWLTPLGTIGIYALSYNDCRAIFRGTLKALDIEVDHIAKVHRPIILACLFLGIAVGVKLQIYYR